MRDPEKELKAEVARLTKKVVDRCANAIAQGGAIAVIDGQVIGVDIEDVNAALCGAWRQRYDNLEGATKPVVEHLLPFLGNPMTDDTLRALTEVAGRQLGLVE